ncbi:hypothetical protein FF1_043881 [Malus domestica]
MVFIYYIDLRKACPKDPYPHPRIDLLVYSTSRNQLLNLLDKYSSHNQIAMYTDKEKTMFVIEPGNYCYKVMPFGLKNPGATYQRLVNMMFKKQIGVTMEVYVNDIMVDVDLHGRNFQYP